MLALSIQISGNGKIDHGDEDDERGSHVCTTRAAIISAAATTDMLGIFWIFGADKQTQS